MSGKIVLKAEELQGFLTDEDKAHCEYLENIYKKAQFSFEKLTAAEGKPSLVEKETQNVIALYEEMGKFMQKITAVEDSIKVYSFETPRSEHAEVSRLISKLRDSKTGQHEFVYYIQRAYEILFKLMYGYSDENRKNYLMVKTPVTFPFQNFAIHKIHDVDDELQDTVMCVMLRGALLPSMILSKEIQEYSSTGYKTPFALFKIQRDDTKQIGDMEYILDLDRSYFKLKDLDGKHLIFADPMNATGGSLVTIIRYLQDQGVKPASIRAVNVIAALKGILQIIRSVDQITCYTLWLDPILNEMAYILPGLGDAGDRINGFDKPDNPRNMIQLIGDYGSNLVSLYRSQVRKIEETILEN